MTDQLSEGLECPKEEEDKSQPPALDNEESKTTTKVNDEEEESDKISPYDYLKRDEFTSERFKVEIRKIHRQLGVKQLKKKIATFGLHAHKVKILHWGAYVTFMTAEDRDKAIKLMNGSVWKGNALEVSIAKPRADPGLQSVKRGSSGKGEDSGVKRSRDGSDDEELSAFERLKWAVAPLSDVPYDQQLERKTGSVRQLLQTYYSRVLQLNPLLESDLTPEKDATSGKPLLCLLRPIQPSPVLERYRNKCEFTIGRDLDGRDRVVGFRIGKHKGGHSCVGSPENLNIVSPPIETVRSALQVFLCDFTKFAAYDPMTYQGFWRSATVRSTRTGDTMLALDVVGDSWDDSDPTEARQAVLSFFTAEQRSNLQLKSLQFIVRRRSGDPLTPANCRVVWGSPVIVERCLGLQFRISLSAFFQVNVLAAEVLYSHVRSLCRGGDDVIVLDLCCGTGTIALCLSKSVHKVIGIEMCAEAVQDAKENAITNEVGNAEFVCGRVEDALPSVIANIDSAKEVVAVLDPPRAGVHNSVIGALRKCPHVRAVVYVSCNPEAAAANFMDLTRPESNRVRGSPFVPVEATPVDLFPQTKHVELVTLWRRV